MSRETHQHQDYSIIADYQGFSDTERQEVVRFWTDEDALGDPNQASERSNQLVVMIRNAAGEIVGVNTAVPTRMLGRPDSYFYFRMYIRPADRVGLLFHQATKAAREHLGKYHHHLAAGVLVVSENEKLAAPALERMFRRLGWERIGENQEGEAVWIYRFDRA